jgi:hypothetical protein
MALAFEFLLAAASPKPAVSPIASPAPATSGGLNLLLVVVAVLVVALLILLLALRRGGRRQEGVVPESEVEKRIAPIVASTPAEEE